MKTYAILITESKTYAILITELPAKKRRLISFLPFEDPLDVTYEDDTITTRVAKPVELDIKRGQVVKHIVVDFTTGFYKQLGSTRRSTHSYASF